MKASPLVGVAIVSCFLAATGCQSPFPSLTGGKARSQSTAQAGEGAGESASSSTATATSSSDPYGVYHRAPGPGEGNYTAQYGAKGPSKTYKGLWGSLSQYRFTRHHDEGDDKVDESKWYATEVRTANTD